MPGRGEVLLFALFVSSASGGVDTAYLPGDTLDRIVAHDGLTAIVVCTGIRSADGLAFSSDGELLVLSESSGELLRVMDDGGCCLVTDGLSSPEGIASDRAGGVLVTEDVAGGRLLRISGDGEVIELMGGLEYPEGVADLADGRILVTESSAESGSFPPFSTGVIIVDGNLSREIFSTLYLWSLSDLVVDEAGIAYVCNELSGFAFITESLIRVNTFTGEWSVFATGLSSCEGICSTPEGFFPLFVAEEDIGDGTGRISSVDSSGAVETVAEGFLNVEDVVVDPSGRIYVTEDTSGLLILLQP